VFESVCSERKEVVARRTPTATSHVLPNSTLHYFSLGPGRNELQSQEEGTLYDARVRNGRSDARPSGKAQQAGIGRPGKILWRDGLDSLAVKMFKGSGLPDTKNEFELKLVDEVDSISGKNKRPSPSGAHYFLTHYWPRLHHATGPDENPLTALPSSKPKHELDPAMDSLLVRMLQGGLGLPQKLKFVEALIAEAKTVSGTLPTEKDVLDYFLMHWRRLYAAAGQKQQ
jgi:hypothetical protein